MELTMLQRFDVVLVAQSLFSIQYSVTKKPSRELSTDLGDIINGFLEVVNAVGVDRAERHRTCKRVLRTVPADYYALID